MYLLIFQRLLAILQDGPAQEANARAQGYILAILDHWERTGDVRVFNDRMDEQATAQVRRLLASLEER